MTRRRKTKDFIKEHMSWIELIAFIVTVAFVGWQMWLRKRDE